MGTVALASIFNAGQANAIDCTNTEPLYVPWSWELELEASNPPSISAHAEIRGDSSTNRVSDPKTIIGTYVVKLLFDEPIEFCDKLGNAPTENSLEIEAVFGGFLYTNLVSNPRDPKREDDPFAEAVAYVDLQESNDSSNKERLSFEKERLFDIGLQLINQKVPAVRQVKDKDRISFTGSLNAFAYKDESFESFHSSTASPFLIVNGTLAGKTSGWVEYTVPVPEPLTILGSATGVGFAAFFKRKHSKKQKKS
jgi:hypothetical protein